MMKKIVFIYSTLFLINAVAQVDEVVLDGNGVAADVSNQGAFFFDMDETAAGYEFPKGSGNHLIFADMLWIGGVDINGQLKLAGGIFASEDNVDFYKGALTNGDAAAGVPPEQVEVYKVSQAEIDYHIAHIGEAGYTVPHGILNWPAHGNVADGFDYYLAPFEDLDGNGDYNPETGDFPTIRGDHAAFLILNDKGGLHNATGGDPLGVEIHVMFYQYDADDYIDSTTFLHVEVINRGTQYFPEFIVGNYMDFDIGDPSNDYAGTNEENDVIYGYNGTTTDAGIAGGSGYGANPPAIGLVSLNRELHVGGYFQNGAGPYGDPSSAADYWNYMNGNWKNGLPFTYGGNGGTTGSDSTVRYMFSGNPTIIADDEWTEVGVANPSGDRRVFGASEAVTFSPGESLCFDYAFVATQSEGDHLANAGRIIELAGDVKDFYAAQTNNHCGGTLSTPDFSVLNDFSIYPNPSVGSFTIEIEGEYNVNILAMDGRLVYEENKLNGKQIINENLAKGQYIVQINQGEKTMQKKLVIR